MQLGWKSSWTEGFANSDGTGVSPGSVIVAAGLRIDFSAEHLYGVLGVAKGATPMQQKATPWDCPDCPFGIVKLKGYQFLLVNVYLTAHIRATGDNTHKMSQLKKLVRMLGLPFLMVGDWNNYDSRDAGCLGLY